MVRAALIAFSLLGGSMPTLADSPPKVVTGAESQRLDQSLRRVPGASPAARAAPDRRRCREQAARLRLFGLGRHKFLQRCRAGRRAVGP